MRALRDCSTTPALRVGTTPQNTRETGAGTCVRDSGENTIFGTDRSRSQNVFGGGSTEVPRRRSVCRLASYVISLGNGAVAGARTSTCIKQATRPTRLEMGRPEAMFG